MFDDPKKHLQWMEEALLAEEQSDTPESEDIYEEAMDFSEDDWEKILEEDWDPAKPPRNNPAVNFSRAYYEDEILDEETAALLQPKGTAARKIAQTQKKEELRQAKKAKKKQKGIGGLVLLALLELLGIFMILGWWINWLL